MAITTPISNSESDQEQTVVDETPSSLSGSDTTPQDLEKQPHSTAIGAAPNASETNASLLVTFDGPDDPMDPFNWSIQRRWAIVFLSSLEGLVTLMSSTMLAPALSDIGRDLSMGVAETQLTLSIFVLSFAFGPMVLAPLAEIYGRRRVWIICSLFYTILNMVCGFSRNKALMISGRLLSGLGASVQFAVGKPILSDCWRHEERGQAFALSTFVPLLGPAIGPILGGVITQSVGWRWLFWTVSIFDALVIIFGYFVLRESYRPVILSRKATLLRKTSSLNYYAEVDNIRLSKKLQAALTRPVRLLCTQPALQLISLFLAYNFGILYITLSTYADIFTQQYHQSASISGLHYIALVIGYTIAAQVGARLTDRLWAHLSRKAGGATAPEYRVPLMVPGAVLIPICLFWYGWAAEARVHWNITDVGAGIYGCGIILGTQAMHLYVLDAYAEYTASAAAAAQLLRSITGFAFPIFAPQMYQTLGYGWGNSVLAFLFLALGVPAPLLLWKYGAKLRAMGKPQW